MAVPARPGPPRVQIQTQSGCNARCIFCPNEAVLKSDLEQGRMPEADFQGIIDELASTQPRRVSLYLQNEPLLDKRLPEFAAYVSERIPNTSTLVTTNGTNLKESMGAALIDSGLKRLKVSIQSLDSEQNKAIMGKSCDADKVVENVLAFKKIIKEKRAKHFDLRISTVVTKINEDCIEDYRRFWKSHGIRLVTSALENRGGNMENVDDLNPGEMEVRDNCIRPSREMCVLFNGDAVLCCVDWHRVEVVGNVFRDSVLDVWNGSRLDHIRNAFACGDTEALPEICVNCTESACSNNHRRGLRGLIKRTFAGAR